MTLELTADIESEDYIVQNKLICKIINKFTVKFPALHNYPLLWLTRGKLKGQTSCEDLNMTSAFCEQSAGKWKILRSFLRSYIHLPPIQFLNTK